MSLITLSSAVLSISLSTWAVLHIYTRLFANNTTPPSLSSYLLFAALAGLLTKLCLSQVNRYLFLRRAKQLGCGTAPLYPHKDPILGLDTFKEALRALESHQLLELYRKRFQKCGSTHYNLVLGSWTLMTEDAENIKTILGKCMDDWPIDGPRLFAALPVLGPNSIFTSNGKTWHAARAMLRPSFSRNTHEAASAELECFRKHVARMISAVPADGTTAFDMQDLLLDMTMDSSTDFLLGRSTNMLGGRQQREKGSEEDMASPAARRFVEDFEYASRESARMARLGPILLSLPQPRLTKAVQRLREYVRGYVAQAREEVSLGVIEEEEEELGLSTTDGGDEGSPRRSTRKKRGVLLDELLRDHAPDDYVTDQIMSILIAGRDTTATALTAVFYFLARAPEVVDKLRAEILAVEEDEPTREQLKQMKYLNNVIREALRLFPPVAVNSRTSNRDTVLPRGGGPDGQQPILVPKGMPVRWSTHALHRNKAIYGPDAEEFRPERWEDLRVGWEYIPFSGGPRICLGQQFALIQMAYTVFRFFREFRGIEARDSGPMLVSTNLTASFAHGCWVSVRR